jgi:hypothetical protein
VKDKIRSAKAAQIEKKTYINRLDSESPSGDSLSDDFMDLECVWEAWLDLREEDTLFNMQDWEAGQGKTSNKKRKSR